FRTSWFSHRINLKVMMLIALAIAILILLMLWAITLGAVDLSIREVWNATWGDGDRKTLLVVRTLRWPRIATAVVIGMALAISGMLFQSIARNPLVSPDIIGINSGATVVAVAWLVIVRNTSQLPLAAFLGAILTAAIIYLLSWRNGASPDRMILVGIGVASMTQAVTALILVRFPLEQIRPAVVWTMGSIYGSTWRDVVITSLVVLVSLPFAILLMQPLRAMSLGDNVTRSLGIPLEMTRLGVILIGCALAAVSVAFAGPIGFVALMVPHMARMIAGPQSGGVLVFSGILGGIILLLSDTLALHFLPVVLPVGVVTGAIGAPYFLFLLYRSNSRM
ncbi:MAG: iron ABC transporter permease, partial [Thermomicrobiales bacterium]|nr:iron ABC transporter permease [Thermomicrobiales bacterium]